MVNCRNCYNHDCKWNIRYDSTCGIKDDEVIITKDGMCGLATNEKELKEHVSC